MKGQANLNKKISEVGLSNCFVSEITILELTFGAENSPEDRKKRNYEVLNDFKTLFHGRIIPIASCFEEFARQKVTLRRAGTPIGEFDLLIGSTALVNGNIMVTGNEKEFSRIEGLKIENWIKRKQSL